MMVSHVVELDMEIERLTSSQSLGSKELVDGSSSVLEGLERNEIRSDSLRE